MNLIKDDIAQPLDPLTVTGEQQNFQTRRHCHEDLRILHAVSEVTGEDTERIGTKVSLHLDNRCNLRTCLCMQQAVTEAVYNSLLVLQHLLVAYNQSCSTAHCSLAQPSPS